MKNNFIKLKKDVKFNSMHKLTLIKNLVYC